MKYTIVTEDEYKGDAALIQHVTELIDIKKVDMDYFLNAKSLFGDRFTYSNYKQFRRGYHFDDFCEDNLLTDAEFQFLKDTVKDAFAQCVSEPTVKDDAVNHPSHYADGQIEVIDFIADKGLIEGFCKGNVIKYVSRAGKKSSASLDTAAKAVQDLEKARWYLDYLINYYKRSTPKEETEKQKER